MISMYSTIWESSYLLQLFRTVRTKFQQAFTIFSTLLFTFLPINIMSSS